MHTECPFKKQNKSNNKKLKNKQKETGLYVSPKTNNKHCMRIEQVLRYCHPMRRGYHHLHDGQRTNIKLGHSCFPS